jgi:hypothetical protein
LLRTPRACLSGPDSRHNIHASRTSDGVQASIRPRKNACTGLSIDAPCTRLGGYVGGYVERPLGHCVALTAASKRSKCVHRKAESRVECDLLWMMYRRSECERARVSGSWCLRARQHGRNVPARVPASGLIRLITHLPLRAYGISRPWPVRASESRPRIARGRAVWSMRGDVRCPASSRSFYKA